MIEFREYTDNDFEDVKGIIKEAFNINVLNIDNDSNVYRLVSVKDEEVVGYLDITFSHDVIRNYKYAFINYVCVSNSCRGLGIGYKLVEKAIEICKNSGVSSIRLTSNPKRCKARDIYLKLGFKIKDTDLFEKVI